MCLHFTFKEVENYGKKTRFCSGTQEGAVRAV